MREIIAAGYDIRMTRIAAEGLDKSWLGRKLTLKDCSTLEELQKKIGLHPAGEGGEFETIVLDAPLFKSPIDINFSISMESENRGELVLK